MVKSTIGAVLACLYVALSVWLVRSEGQSYRNSLKQARPTAAVTDNPVREHTAVAVELPKADVAPPRAPEPQPAEGRDKVAAALALATAPAAEATGPRPGVPLAAESKLVAPQPPQVAMLKPDSARAPEVKLANLDPYWSQPDVKKNWDLSNLSDLDEMRLGEDLHNMIMQFNPPRAKRTLARTRSCGGQTAAGKAIEKKHQLHLHHPRFRGRQRVLSSRRLCLPVSWIVLLHRRGRGRASSVHPGA